MPRGLSRKKHPELYKSTVKVKAHKRHARGPRIKHESNVDMAMLMRVGQGLVKSGMASVEQGIEILREAGIVS